MKYYSFLPSIGNQYTPDKLFIVQNIINEHYKNFINEHDHIVVVNEINVLLWPNLQKINEIEKKQNEKIIVFILDVIDTNYISSLDILNHANQIWCAELDIFHLLKSQFNDVKLMPLVHTNSLKNCINEENPTIDVIMYGWLDFFSVKILDSLLNLGYNVFHTAHLDDLNKNLGNSKIALCLSQYENIYQEQTKIRYLLSNNKCVVTTTSRCNNFPEVIERDHKDTLSTLIYLLKDDRWKKYITM